MGRKTYVLLYYHQPLSTTITHYQPLSTTINHHQPFSSQYRCLGDDALGHSQLPRVVAGMAGGAASVAATAEASDAHVFDGLAECGFLLGGATSREREVLWMPIATAVGGGGE